jgi:hypothetical protein
MPNFACPYCGQMAQFPATNFWMTGRLPRLGPRAHGNLIQCPNPMCRGLVLAGTTQPDQQGNYRVMGLLPMATVQEPDETIPAAIRADLFEARLCASADAYKATAVLCRRALQGACVEQGATPKKNLHDQIDEVIASNKVHGSLRDSADAIRLIGNSGAHVGDDGLEAVSADEADDILAFTEEFMQLTYVARERVRRRLDARGRTTSP